MDNILNTEEDTEALSHTQLCELQMAKPARERTRALHPENCKHKLRNSLEAGDHALQARLFISLQHVGRSLGTIENHLALAKSPAASGGNQNLPIPALGGCLLANATAAQMPAEDGERTSGTGVKVQMAR